MCASLTNGYAFDQAAADLAWLAGLPVDAEVVLEIPAAVNPVDAGPVAADTLLQHGADRLPQCLGLVLPVSESETAKGWILARCRASSV